tara:strand:+ start:663 stop:1811 length:1149 start_codon:yes stop_codon:yes gene_type:complete
MNKKNYFNIIDLGSSRVRLSVFDNKLSNIFSESKNLNFNKDEIDNFNNIQNLIKKAEKKISSHLDNIILLVDSNKLLNIQLSIQKSTDINTNVGIIYKSILMELNQLIKSNYLEYDIIHTILDSCIIDNVKHDELPKNINKIKNLKINFTIICFPRKNIELLRKNFNKYNIQILSILCTSFTKTLSYLNKLSHNKLSFMDIGWERTSIIIYENYKLKFIDTIPIGGFHITKDISKIFKIDLEEAENIKKSFNKSENEFSYKNEEKLNQISAVEIFNKNISVDLLKKVILYRVQEIIDLSLNKLQINLKNTDLFLIGGGSILFKNNSFYLKDKSEFNSINYYVEQDAEICKSGLTYYLNNSVMLEKSKKKQGLFEKFFNFFGR